MNNPEIAILDYGLGNIKSISEAVKNVGGVPILTRSREAILNSDAMILSGVGAFAYAIETLSDYDLIDPIKDFVSLKKPVLGICLGMQLLFDESEEFGSTKGFSFIKGRVVKLPIGADSSEKLPHVMWNELRETSSLNWKNTILDSIPDKSNVYFVHSYICQPLDRSGIIAVTEYGGFEFCSVVRKDNVYGCQFHPEKSGRVGLAILENFVKIKNN